MNREEFNSLGLGDVIENEHTKQLAVVMAHFGSRVTGARTFDITNPSEWKLKLKASFEKAEAAPSEEVPRGMGSWAREFEREAKEAKKNSDG